MTGLERIIRFGNIFQSQSANTTNTLFGDLPMVFDIQPPKIQNCEPWTLTELLEHEKEVTGMFISGHPLDHFRFEIHHYGITKLSDFNEIKEAVTLQANPNKVYRLAGLVTDAQHRISKNGKEFGSFVLEDYSGKSDFILFGEDYMKFRNYLERGKNLFVCGGFRKRFNREEFEFRIDKVMLLETIKQVLTKQVIIDVEARFVNEELVRFVEKNVKTHPGRSGLKFQVIEPKNNWKIGMYMMENGFEMNDEMAAFLSSQPELEVQVISN
jgi:DNA polymerase-3 subunit alpha